MQNHEAPTIIVADDIDIGRKLLKTHLAKRYNVVEARNGLEVVDYLKSSENQISCILLDLLMPVMDGIKVLEFMRENDLLEQIPVIAVTAISDAKGKIACYEAGASEIVEKPYDPALLMNRVDHYVRLYAKIRAAESAPRAEADPQASYYSAILDSLPQAVFVLDGATFRIKYVNAAFGLIPGMPASPAGKQLAEVFPPAECATIAGAVSEMLSTRVLRPVTFSFGGLRFAAAFNAIVDASGSVSDVIGTAVNVTPGSEV